MILGFDSITFPKLLRYWRFYKVSAETSDSWRDEKTDAELIIVFSKQSGVLSRFFIIFLALETFFEIIRVGKTWLPYHDLFIIIPWSWRIMIMIMPWWRDGVHVSWHGRHNSWYDHAMITMFSMIHAMLFPCYPRFFLKKIALFVNVFSNTWHTRLPLEKTTPPNRHFSKLHKEYFRNTFLLR